ncbi:MAG TPA: hypothetical protein VIC08_04970, partial [Cellvibrionaceae bacterium]
MKTKSLLSAFVILCAVLATPAWAQKVYVAHDKELPQAAYATRKLGEALKEQGYSLQSKSTGYDYLISLAKHPERLKAEAFQVIPEGKVISVYGGDNRGMIYGALAVAESLNNGTRLEQLQAREEAPALEFRGIKYNLPWETYRPSSALDQHYETARDLKYWEAFLDMMVENRFNVISFWNTHPYTFMTRPKNFPEASPWSKKEQAEWRRFYQQLFLMAKERGLDTYIVHWSIFVSEAFAEAHDMARENFYP